MVVQPIPDALDELHLLARDRLAFRLQELLQIKARSVSGHCGIRRSLKGGRRRERSGDVAIGGLPRAPRRRRTSNVAAATAELDWLVRGRGELGSRQARRRRRQRHHNAIMLQALGRPGSGGVTWEEGARGTTNLKLVDTEL